MDFENPSGQEIPRPPDIKPQKFLEFTLSDEEFKAASKMNPVNVLYLHNLRTQLVRDLLNQELTSATPEHYFNFHLHRAYLTAQLALLDKLIGD